VGKSEEELRRLAGQVLVSALAVPVNQKGEEAVEEVKGKTGRLTSLLGLSKTPTRTGLLRDAVSFNDLQHFGCLSDRLLSIALAECSQTHVREYPIALQYT
jgi:hypothetical protein